MPMEARTAVDDRLHEIEMATRRQE